MKDQMEIQRVHDIMCAVVLGEVPSRFPDAPSKLAFNAALNALCWVPESGEGAHPGAKMFGDNIAKIERDLAAKGFVLRRRNN